MRIIKASTVREWMQQHPSAAPGLAWCADTIKAGSWKNLVELKRTFPAADQVKVASGRTVLVFNISGNAFRLMAAMHFNRGLVFALAFMSHAEYSKDRWKDKL
jgi:mRNA interferase HigB